MKKLKASSWEGQELASQIHQEKKEDTNNQYHK